MSNDHDLYWPSLPLNDWKATYETLHMWTQIVGKVRLKLSPFVNHWWSSALYLTSRGLTTSPIPFGERTFEIQLDFIDHALRILSSDGARRGMALAPRSVADFYSEFMELIRSIDVPVKINTLPNEIPDPIRFEEDERHKSYDREYANRVWRILAQADRVFKEFRGGFVGKCSPVHFFWGSFDLAVTRFSGKRAPENSDLDQINRIAYSHEAISCGFWPGSGNIQEPAFYAYAAPEPAGFSQGRVQPSQAFYNAPTKGFILKYEDVRKSRDPDRMILDFAQSTYERGADLGHWDRAALERAPVRLQKAA